MISFAGVAAPKPLFRIMLLVAFGCVVCAEKVTTEVFVAPVWVRPLRISVWMLPAWFWSVFRRMSVWPPVSATAPTVSA